MEYDTVGPPELVKDSTPLTVPPGSTLTLSFSGNPEEITVDVWKDNEPVRITIIDGKIITPESEGLIVYEVTGTWEQGTAWYAFLVDVE
jgi:hypothetical protein